MIDKFINWYTVNYRQITWFIIGWLTMAGMTALAAGNYTSAMIDFALVGLNYMFVKR